MSYLDIGYDEFLNPINQPANTQQQIDPLEFDTFTDQIPGDKVQGGVLSSADGKTKLDLEKGVFKINDGTEDLISLGLLPDGSIGLLIKDNQGHALMQISSESNIIKSKTGNFEIDLDNLRLLFRDNNGTPQAVFGEI